MNSSEKLNEIMQHFAPIALEEVAAVKLMDRVDTKYVTSVSVAMRFLEHLEQDFLLQQIEGKSLAQYITTYYDTLESDYYRIHQSLRSVRQKVRIRHYLDTQTSFLEIKNKNNKGRTKKERIPHPFGQDIALAEFDEFLTPRTLFDREALLPHLRNTFHRLTLLNNAHTERLTIDFGLSFENLRTAQSGALHRIAIIELKQQGNIPSAAKELLRRERIFPRGFSKYCIGAALTNPDLPTNNLKRKLQSIRHL